MSLKWNKFEDIEPKDKQECYLANEMFEGFLVGPIVYVKDAKGWIDIFATPEAGALYNVENGVAYWIEAKAILPEDLDNI